MSMEEITVDTGYAANLSRNSDENYLTISGVAIGEDEITSHAQGDKFWPAEQLMAATQSLIGTQLTKNHEHNKVEGVIGEVTDARYKEGVGVLFEARVYEESVANKIEEGLLEVSIHAIHSNGGWTEDGAMIVENIEFRDLSVVPRGAAESNEVRVGTMEPATLSAESIEEIVGDEFDTELQEDELNDVWERFQETVNMTAGQLRSWSENPCSREASQDPEAVISRNLRLLSRNKDEWTEDDVIDAKRTISFVSRMREQKPTDPRDGPVEGCPSKWAISLLNWAYNPFDNIPSIPEEMEPVDEITLDEHEQEEELSEVHEVSYEGTEENDWSAPNLEDFPDEYFDSEGNAKFDLVDDHFLYSETQFPPEKYTELKFPVVSPEGMLNLAALRAAKSRAPQADISSELITEIQETVNNLANSEFDKDWDNESQESADESDDVREASSSSVESGTSQDSDTMTEEDNTEDIDVEALEERISTLEEQKEALESEVQSVRMEYAEALAGDGTFSAEELAEKFTVEELSEKYEDSEAEIAEASEPEPQTGSVEEEEVEASEEEDEEIALLEVQIEKYDEMGWTGAKAEAESKLSTLRDEDAE